MATEKKEIAKAQCIEWRERKEPRRGGHEAYVQERGERKKV